MAARPKISAQFAKDQFDLWLGNVLQTCHRTAEVVVREQFKAVIKTALTLTPPMSSANKTYAKGLRANTQAIKRDLNNAFIPIKSKYIGDIRFFKRKGINPEMMNESPTGLLRWFQSNQKANKRIPPNFQKRPVWDWQMVAINELLKKKIGTTAAGWARAADELGIALPEWISKNKGHVVSIYRYKHNKKLIQFLARNESRMPNAGAIQNQLKLAYYLQAQKMKNRIIAGLASGKIDRGQIMWS